MKWSSRWPFYHHWRRWTSSISQPPMNPMMIKADSRFAMSQWETELLGNNVSHWPGASLESALMIMYSFRGSLHFRMKSRVPFQYKGHLSRYGDSHHQDKLVILFLWWEFLYWWDGIVILKWHPGGCINTKMSYKYRNYHYLFIYNCLILLMMIYHKDIYHKDNIQSCYQCNGNSYTWKDCLPTESGPRSP